MRNFDSELAPFQFTFLTLTAHCSSTSSVSSETFKTASKSSPNRSRPFRLSAILNELVKCQSHVTGLFNTPLLFNALKFAEFHNQFPLLTMFKWYSYSMITNFFLIQQCFLLRKLISSHLIIPSLVLNTAQSHANARILRHRHLA